MILVYEIKSFSYNKPLVEILTCAVDGNHQGMVTMLYQTFCAGEFVKPPAGLGYITYSGAHQQCQ